MCSEALQLQNALECGKFNDLKIPIVLAVLISRLCEGGNLTLSLRSDARQLILPRSSRRRND